MSDEETSDLYQSGIGLIPTPMSYGEEHHRRLILALNKKQEEARVLLSSLAGDWKQEDDLRLAFAPSEPVEKLWQQMAEEVWPVTRAEVLTICDAHIEDIGEGESEEDCRSFLAGQKLITRALEIAEQGSTEARVALLLARLYWQQLGEDMDSNLHSACIAFSGSLVVNFLEWFDAREAKPSGQQSLELSLFDSTGADISTAESRSGDKKLPRRTGQKLQTRPSEKLRLPTTEYAKDVLMGLGRGQFIPTEGNNGVYTVFGKSELFIECDPIGFDTMKAVEMLAAYGPATMQTFLGLMGLWIENNPGSSHETYFTVRVSDLMRYMHRKELGGGGYQNHDQIQKGREVYILSRATVPRATVKRVNYNSSSRTVETLALDRLLHVQTMTAQRTLEDGQEVQSVLEFRYHPNKEMHEMLCGDTPQFAEVSGKLLGYHPVKEKYQIMLGFGLAFYDRVNKKHGKTTHKIGLQSLLALAGIEIPTRNPARFLAQIQAAVNKLSADGVITGAAVNVSPSNSLSIRQKLATAEICFPSLFAQSQKLLS